MTRVVPSLATPRESAPLWRRRLAVITLAAALAPLAGIVPVASAETAAVDVVAPAAEQLTIEGDVRVGETISLDPRRALWQPADVELGFTYQWFADGAAVEGATGGTLALTPAMVEERISVEVTGTAPEGSVDGRRSDLVVVAAGDVAPGTLSAPVPAISGTAQVGKTLTAVPGTWTPAATLTYQWLRSGVAIAGATAKTYVATAWDRAKTLTVRVTGAEPGYASTSTTSAGVYVRSGTFTASTPTISGQVRTGATVSVSRGTWTPSPSVYRYRWRVDGVAIRGATESRFTVPSTFGGRKLSVTVTGSRSGYTTKAVTSASRTVARSYTRTSAPTISGTARVGSTLKVGSYGTWRPSPSSWKYQWKANGASISGATSRSFTLTRAQHGKKITVTVTAVRTGYYRTSRTSAATATVAWPVGVSTPQITADPQDTLAVAGDSAWFSVGAGGGQLRYQWQLSSDGTTWTNLDGKTSSTLTLSARSSRDGYQVRVVVWNVAGKVSSSAATLWVDSTRIDPYEVGARVALWSWGGVVGVTTAEAWTSTTRLVSAQTKMCYYGLGSAYPKADLTFAYVGGNGTAYTAGSQRFEDDIWGVPEIPYGGCTVFTAYAVVPTSEVSGGTWRISDSSGSTYRQWAKGWAYIP